MLKLRELFLEPLRGLGAHEDAAVVYLARLLERAADLEECGIGLVEQCVTLTDVVHLKELEYVVRLLAAVGVLDPDAEISHVIPVARHLLKLAGAALEEGKHLGLASTGRERLLRPLDEPHPHLERVITVVCGDSVPKGAVERGRGGVRFQNRPVTLGTPNPERGRGFVRASPRTFVPP